MHSRREGDVCVGLPEKMTVKMADNLDFFSRSAAVPQTGTGSAQWAIVSPVKCNVYGEERFVCGEE